MLRYVARVLVRILPQRLVFQLVAKGQRIDPRIGEAVLRVLTQLHAFAEVVEIVERVKPLYRTDKMVALLASALFEMGRFDDARNALSGFRWISGGRLSPSFVHLKGELDLIAGDEISASRTFRAAAATGRQLIGPHQNLAAPNVGSRVLNNVDIAAGTLGILYDEYNYVGQRVIHVGAGHLGPALFGRALEHQQSLRQNLPPISESMAALLSSLDITLEELRLVTAEWFTQVGHQAGLLDVLFRMRELGWWSGKAILLPDNSKIANRPLLALYEREGPILWRGIDIDGQTSEELVSLQRYCGMSFNAFKSPDGTVVPWQDAVAVILQQWEEEKRPLPLRMAFDAPGSAGEFAADAAAHAFEQWGLDNNDWYVCLHIRDALHYGEISGLGQTHRNSGVSNYISAIEYIIGLGGKVIRLGGSRAPDLPTMDGLIDYARSASKSELLDLWLIRNCKFFIGTTSGLTNVAIGFGIPCALVNCISVDAQLWHKNVRFAPKTVFVNGHRELSQSDLTSTPWRWRMFSAETLLHHNATAHDNTADEVLETVKEVYALAWGKIYEAKVVDPDGMRRLWRSCLSFPHFYGAALPSLYYLHRHFDKFIRESDAGGGHREHVA